MEADLAQLSAELQADREEVEAERRRAAAAAAEEAGAVGREVQARLEMAARETRAMRERWVRGARLQGCSCNVLPSQCWFCKHVRGARRQGGFVAARCIRPVTGAARHMIEAAGTQTARHRHMPLKYTCEHRLTHTHKQSQKVNKTHTNTPARAPTHKHTQGG
jgi:hypothetical protein